MSAVDTLRSLEIDGVMDSDTLKQSKQKKQKMLVECIPGQHIKL